MINSAIVADPASNQEGIIYKNPQPGDRCSLFLREEDATYLVTTRCPCDPRVIAWASHGHRMDKDME